MSRRIALLLLVVAAANPSVAWSQPPASMSVVTDPEQQILLPPQTRESSSSANAAAKSAPWTGNTLTTAVGGLAICLGVFFLFIWVTKRHAPQGNAPIPKEAVESLGRTVLSPRRQLQLLRIGHKLLLLDVTPQGARTLTEVTDPIEVDRLLSLCQQSRPNSVTTSFREVLADYETTPAAPGFLGDAKRSDWELAAQAPRRRTDRRGGSDD